MEHFIVIVNFNDGTTKEFDFIDKLLEAENFERLILKSSLANVKETFLISRTI